MASLGEHSTGADWMGAREAAGAPGSEAPGRGHRGPPKAKHGQSGMLTVSRLFFIVNPEKCKINMVSIREKKFSVSGSNSFILVLTGMTIVNL